MHLLCWHSAEAIDTWHNTVTAHDAAVVFTTSQDRESSSKVKADSPAEFIEVGMAISDDFIKIL